MAGKVTGAQRSFWKDPMTIGKALLATLAAIGSVSALVLGGSTSNIAAGVVLGVISAGTVVVIVLDKRAHNRAASAAAAVFDWEDSAADFYPPVRGLLQMGGVEEEEAEGLSADLARIKDDEPEARREEAKRLIRAYAQECGFGETISASEVRLVVADEPWVVAVIDEITDGNENIIL